MTKKMTIIKNRAWQTVKTAGIEWDGIPIEKLSAKNTRRALVFSMITAVKLQSDLEEAMEEVDVCNVELRKEKDISDKLREEITHHHNHIISD